jgi:hypothetical protein
MDDSADFSSSVHTHELTGTDDGDWMGGYEPSQYQRFRHSDWAVFRKQTFDVLQASGATEASLRRFVQCGSTCTVWHSPSEQRLYISSETCKNRFCVPCSKARRSQISKNLAAFCDGRHLRLITLTLAHHNAPLEDLITRLWGSFKLLRRRADWNTHVHGFAAFMELKWSPRSKWWHVHLHILCEGSWWDNKELSNAWHTVTADSFVTDIREVTTNEGITYTAKYASKPLALADIPQDQRTTAVRSIHHRRLWLVGGTWRGNCKLLATKPLPADLVFVSSFSALLHEAKRGDAPALELIKAIVGGAAEEFTRADEPDFDTG